MEEEGDDDEGAGERGRRPLLLLPSCGLSSLWRCPRGMPDAMRTRERKRTCGGRWCSASASMGTGDGDARPSERASERVRECALDVGVEGKLPCSPRSSASRCSCNAFSGKMGDFDSRREAQLDSTPSVSGSGLVLRRERPRGEFEWIGNGSLRAGMRGLGRVGTDDGVVASLIGRSAGWWPG
jgi:hypothetical protein